MLILDIVISCTQPLICCVSFSVISVEFSNSLWAVTCGSCCPMPPCLTAHIVFKPHWKLDGLLKPGWIALWWSFQGEQTGVLYWELFSAWSSSVMKSPWCKPHMFLVGHPKQSLISPLACLPSLPFSPPHKLSGRILCQLQPLYVLHHVCGAVSYTHLTLPTTSRV